MTRRQFMGAVTALAAAALTAGTVAAQAAPAGKGTGSPVTAEPVIVVLADAGPRSERAVAAHAKAHGVTPTHVYAHTLRGYAANLPPQRIAQLEADAAVAAVYPDRLVRRRAPVSGVQVQQEPEQPAQVPSNAVRRVGGLDSPTATIDGIDERVDVDIAVVDGGIQPDHPDLNVAGGVDCVRGPGSGGPGVGWYDRDGHGTMVGGFAGAIDNDIGRVGVSPGARLWAVRVAQPDGLVRDSALMCGLNWVVEHADTIEVANLSLVGVHRTADTDCVPPHPSPYHGALCAALASGVTVVAAAGNGSVDVVENNIAPAHMPAVITVSAIADSDGQPGGLGPDLICLPEEDDDTFAFFSNYGAAVDLAAPGVCVGSTFIGSQYATHSGTSFAAPLVAGAAGLYLATHPGTSPAEVQAELVDRAEPGPIPGDPDNFPEGILDVSTL